jgi:hypothetical protein
MAHRRAIEVVSRAPANLIYKRNPRTEFESLQIESLPVQGLRDDDAPRHLSGPLAGLAEHDPALDLRRYLPDGNATRPPLLIDPHCLPASAETVRTQQPQLGWTIRILRSLPTALQPTPEAAAKWLHEKLAKSKRPRCGRPSQERIDVGSAPIRRLSSACATAKWPTPRYKSSNAC